MPKYLILTVLSVMNIVKCDQDKNDSFETPNDFVRIEIPNKKSDVWKQMNSSLYEANVKVINGKIDISRAQRNKLCSLVIESGTLQGSDHGEWEGDLTFTANHNPESKIEIKRGNIKYIFEFKNNIYFLEGLNHLGYKKGAMFELIHNDGKFTYQKVVEFNDAPYAYAIHGDNLYVVTFENLFVINNFKKELIFENMFWSGLYPNSLAIIDEKNVFVGMRGGFARLNLINKEMQIFQKKL